MKKMAYTLAEIIIVVGIIGIVAEMTIPALVTNVQNTTFAESAKKVYSDFNNILTRLANDTNCMGDLTCTGLFSSDTNSNNLGDAVDSYFKVIKLCANAAGCFPTATAPNFDRTGTAVNYDTDGTGYKFITASKMSYFIYNQNNGCDDVSMNRTTNMKQRCGYIIVDTNGTKGPNAMGRDVFKFWITNGKGAILYPAGGSDDKNGGADSWWNATSGTRGCGNNNNGGAACAGRLLEDGWIMKY